MPNDGSPSARELPWVIVRVGRSRLGLPSGMVREMMALPAVARVPGLPPDVPGVITWRGQVVPLVDLRVRLQEPDAGRAVGPRMSVVVSPGAGERERAFAVDAIDGVEVLEADSRNSLPEGLEQKSGMVREFGRLRRDGTLVLLLDVGEALGIARTEDADHEAAERLTPSVLASDTNGFRGGRRRADSARGRPPNLARPPTPDDGGTSRR